LQSFQNAKKLAPDNADVLAGLAQAQSGVLRPKVDPVPPKTNLQDLIATAQTALKAKDYDAAEKALRAAGAIDAKNAAVLQGLKDVAQGRKALADAQVQADFQAAVGVGQKAYQVKNFDAAIKAYQQALKLVPNDPGALKLLQQAQDGQTAAANFQ